MLVACHGDINHVYTQNFFDPETSVSKILNSNTASVFRDSKTVANFPE